MPDATWPVELRGITESIVTTLGPNDRWNVAALGLHAPDGPQATTPAGADASENTGTSQNDRADGEQRGDGAVTAQTWGRTRTWRNFRERGGGYIQFTRDPELFVAATLTIHEVDSPVLDAADAWVQVDVDRRDSGTDGGTQWVDWELTPIDASVERRVVPTFNRGYAAVVEATVAASRLDVDAYDTDRLRDRIEFFESVAMRCGSEAERRAFDALRRAVPDRE